MQNQAFSSAATPQLLNLDELSNLGQGSWHLGWHDGRQYWVYTPLNYQVGTAVPLIMILHGCAQPSVFFIAYDTHMNQLADTHQFLVIYPDHSDPKHLDINPIHCWNFFSRFINTVTVGNRSVLLALYTTCSGIPPGGRLIKSACM